MRWWDWATLAVATLCLVSAAGALVDGRWLSAVALTALAAILGTDVRRRLRGSRAAQDWPTDRVRSVTGGHPDEVQAVRALRAADSRLGLADAVRLVRAARG